MCVAFFPACRLRSRDVPRSIDSSTRSGNRSNCKLWRKMKYRTLSASSFAACLSDSIDARPSSCSLLCDMAALTASRCFLGTEDPRSFDGPGTLEPDFVASCLVSLADLTTDKRDQLLFIIHFPQEASVHIWEFAGCRLLFVGHSRSSVTHVLSSCPLVGHFPKRHSFVVYNL